MPHRNKSREEIAQQFWVTKADIQKLLVCTPRLAKQLFDVSKVLEGTSEPYSVGEDNKVRVKTVLTVAGISQEEFESKIKTPL